MEWEVNVPKWENEGTEPSDELIQNGFSAGYKPPANIFNWFWNRVTDAIREIHVKLYNENYDRIAMDGVLQENIDKKADLSSFLGHVSNQQNPHGVTKSQVGLGNVDNTSDINKPVSTAVQTVLDTKADKTAVVENNSSLSRATLNRVGWYKIAEFNNTETNSADGNYTNSCELAIKRVYNSAANECHNISFSSVTGIHTFTSLSNASRTQLITKCCYVGTKTVNGKDFLYIYYNSSSGNPVEIAINNAVSFGMYWKSITPEFIGTDDISDAVVYDIPANSELAQKEVVLWSGTQIISPGTTRNTATYISIEDSYLNYKQIGIDYAYGIDVGAPRCIINIHDDNIFRLFENTDFALETMSMAGDSNNRKHIGFWTLDDQSCSIYRIIGIL